ncbi:thiol:disulfide interchange protein DsbG [Aliiglaciecola sp. LCG003]|uniref:thiol:disulfide interchange protein DsbG n=1 Tax=Aliiglaciecola sp. LCG003 TaxID=3053655 RepID=UPI002572F357|nr:thiol:disulfide interchange protein DsbG [Aliiglaciecola sp. LCG003]WJG10764.1 thiol:disulfide interchange protein DsbG [Aliiglaciecola sp. LCG003]
MKYLRLVTLILFTNTAIAGIDDLPAPLKLLTQQGVEIVDQFDAPSGVMGYIADFRGQAMTLYVTADKKYLFTGAMLDATGINLGEQALQAYITGPKSDKEWKQLESSHWIADGSEAAERIVYTFTDPNCPYCKKFWQSARPWVASGQVQIRHILVGILSADSHGKAAAIFTADDPSAILGQHEAGNLDPELKPLQNASAEVLNKLTENRQTMQDFGVSATPATFYRSASGAVKQQMGLPTQSVLSQIFGPVMQR